MLTALIITYVIFLIKGKKTAQIKAQPQPVLVKKSNNL
jgi:hypothetical protein